MKTKEELNALREEVKTLNKKLAELTEEELGQVCGGAIVKLTLPKVGVSRITVEKGSEAL